MAEPRGPILPEGLPSHSPTSTEMSTPHELKSVQEAPRRDRKHDASNFDDYLVVGLVAGVTIALFAALILL
jgi:hypothetical protein